MRVHINSALSCLEKHGFALINLPSDWWDIEWTNIQRSYGLTDVQMTSLQYDLIQREAVKSGLSIVKGNAKLALRSLRINDVTEDQLPLDFQDRKWLQIQKRCGISSVDWALFRYAAAAIRSTSGAVVANSNGQVNVSDEKPSYKPTEVVRAAECVVPVSALRRRKVAL